MAYTLNTNSNKPASIAGIKPITGVLSAEAIRHLLKRATFGASIDNIKQFTGKTAVECIDILLNTYERQPYPPVNDYNDLTYIDDKVAPGDPWIYEAKPTGVQDYWRTISLKAWWASLMINQKCTLREKMVLFWHNHFVVEYKKIGCYMSYHNNVMLRQYSLGNYKQMVKAVSRDMGMLRYLNGTSNSKKAPDENYGRELQELFTIGKGSGAHYNEDDVKAAARILTGFVHDIQYFSYKFIPARHDTGDKPFSSFYNNKVIKGRTGPEGEDELDDLIDMIFEKEEVSLFICRKLYQFFVYHTVDIETEKNIIVPLSRTLRQNNFEIKPVLSQLFQSNHFFDHSNTGCIIKNPIDFTVGLIREFGVQFPGNLDIAEKKNFYYMVVTYASRMQLEIGDPPNVAGWPAWYQQPQFDKIWINSDTLPNRNTISDKMLNSGFYKSPFCHISIDVIQFTSMLSNPSDPDQLIKDSVAQLLSKSLSEKEQEELKINILLSGLQGNDVNHYWMQAWQNLESNPNDKANRNNVTSKLKALYKYLMNLPQYQLC